MSGLLISLKRHILRVFPSHTPAPAPVDKAIEPLIVGARSPIFPAPRLNSSPKTPCATATDHPSPTGETPNLYQDRSTPPRRARTGNPELETGALPCSARYPSQLASSGVSLVLEAPLQTSLKEIQNRGRDMALIKTMALIIACGKPSASRELLRLGIHVFKRTIQKYMRNGEPAFLADLGHVLAQPCKRDLGVRLLASHGLLFRSLFAFFIIELQEPKSHACRRDPSSHRCLGLSTAGKRHLWADAADSSSMTTT